MILRKIFSKDITRLILQKIFPFKFETWWLRNERCNMMKDYLEKNNSFLSEIIEVAKGTPFYNIPLFLDRYRHEIGVFYIDTYDCPNYIDQEGKVCTCGENGEIKSAVHCEYENWEGKWVIYRDFDSWGKMSALEISKDYYSEDSVLYPRILEEKRIRICQTPPKLYKFRFKRNN